MKYIALIYTAPDAGPKPDTPEFGAMMGGYQKAGEVFSADGVFVAGEPLESTANATSLRVRGGKVETMDGPFAETKEQLGGFYMFDCDTLDDALRYAAMIPSAEFGTIEVRPIMNFG
ncbi:MAG: hypothetical protein ACI861_002366 [Paracoccaceae bacterium]|jgi:hypothetical protein